MSGKIGEFAPGTEDWTSYTERIEQYCIASDKDSDAKKKAVLLSSMGPEPYKVLKDLIAPAKKPSDLTFDEIKKKLKPRYEETTTLILRRFRFNNRDQKECEDTTSYVAALRSLAQECEFGDFLDQALRDRLVCGMEDETAQTKLLGEKDELTFEEALKIAVNYEASTKGQVEIGSKKEHSSTAVNKIVIKDKEKRNRQEDTTLCYRA